MDERQHALIIESGEYFNQSKEGSIDPCRKQQPVSAHIQVSHDVATQNMNVNN